MYAISAKFPQESISEKTNDNGTRSIKCLGRSAIRSSFPNPSLGLKVLLVKRSNSESMNVLANGKMRHTGVPRIDLREAISESI